MPTPSGMLKAGELIRHKTSGDIIQVVERIGNDRQYSVRVRMKQRGPNSTGVRSVHIAPDKTWLITEVAYWLQQGHYEIVDESSLRAEHQCENMLGQENWPFMRRCNRRPSRIYEILVGKAAGTWDPIYEKHALCDSCVRGIETKETV